MSFAVRPGLYKVTVSAVEALAADRHVACRQAGAARR
jgi:hypothetical protein